MKGALITHIHKLVLNSIYQRIEKIVEIADAVILYTYRENVERFLDLLEYVCYNVSFPTENRFGSQFVA